jgi:26S proteasome non-ATPase regulatory subunit 10
MLSGLQVLKLTIKVDKPDDEGWTPLIIAASAGHVELVNILLDAGASVSALTSQGRSALLYCASKGREELCSLLISRGADPNKQDVHGATPLHRAAGPGHAGVVRILLAADRTVTDCQDRYGNTALHAACEEERAEVAQLLISHGANRELQNGEEKTPLELCSPAFARSLRS